MKRKKTVQIGDAPGVVERVRKVFAAWGGRDDAPDVPRGWQHVGTSPDGQPMFA